MNVIKYTIESDGNEVFLSVKKDNGITYHLSYGLDRVLDEWFVDNQEYVMNEIGDN